MTHWCQLVWCEMENDMIYLRLTAFKRESGDFVLGLVVPKEMEEAVRQAAGMPEGAVGEWQLPLDFFVGYVQG